MQPWHHYVVLGVIGLIANLLYAYRNRHGDYTRCGWAKKTGILMTCYTLPMAIIALPYILWVASGFQPIDARDAEAMMEKRYIKEGAAQTEAHFMITGHYDMSGYVNVTMPDGTRQVLSCKAEKGETAEYLINCRP